MKTQSKGDRYKPPVPPRIEIDTGELDDEQGRNRRGGTEKRGGHLRDRVGDRGSSAPGRNSRNKRQDDE